MSCQTSRAPPGHHSPTLCTSLNSGPPAAAVRFLDIKSAVAGSASTLSSLEKPVKSHQHFCTSSVVVKAVVSLRDREQLETRNPKINLLRRGARMFRDSRIKLASVTWAQNAQKAVDARSMQEPH